MDVAFRLSGNMDFKIVQKEKHVDLISAHIQQAFTNRFGGDLSALMEPWRHTYAVVCIGLKNGTVASFEGLDAIESKPWIFDSFCHYKIGDHVTTSGQFSQTAIRLFLEADDRDQLRQRVNEIKGALDVKNENGESMLLDACKKRL